MLEVCSWYDCLILVKAWFLVLFMRFHEWTVVNTVFLARASVSRLGETNRGSPKLFCANCRSGNWSSFWARCNLA